VSGHIEKVLKGHILRSKEDIKAVVVQWYQQQLNQFSVLSVEQIHQLVYQCNACPSVHGDYF
jgi:hypothetical protein